MSFKGAEVSNETLLNGGRVVIKCSKTKKPQQVSVYNKTLRVRAFAGKNSKLNNGFKPSLSRSIATTSSLSSIDNKRKALFSWRKFRCSSVW